MDPALLTHRDGVSRRALEARGASRVDHGQLMRYPFEKFAVAELQKFATALR